MKSEERTGPQNPPKLINPLSSSVVIFRKITGTCFGFATETFVSLGIFLFAVADRVLVSCLESMCSLTERMGQVNTRSDMSGTRKKRNDGS